MALEEVGVKLLAENADKFEKDIKDSERVFLALIGTLESGAKDIDGAMGKGEKALDSFADVGADSFSRIDAASEIVIGALRRVGEMTVNFALDAGQALAGFVADSVNVAADYETTLNRFGSVTGDSLAAAGMSVDDFSDLFLQLGMDTQFSAQQAADAAVELAKGGMAPATIAAGGLEASLNLAAAGGLGLAESGEILAKQLGVWASKGVDAETVTNLLAQAANASTVDVDELANGLANVQGRAAAMGVEYEDLVQTMALIAPGFESASTAGTSLNNFLARLIPTSDSAIKGMTDLGLVTAEGESLFYDAAGAFVGMEEASRLLQSGMAGLSEEEKAFALQLAFGNDAMGAAVALAEGGPAAFNAMGASMGLAGSAADQAAELNKGWNFSVDTLKGSIETFQIQSLLPFLDRMSTYVDRVTAAANETFAWADSILSADDPLAALMGEIDKAIPGFVSFIDTIAGIPAKVTELSDAFQSDFAPQIQLASDIFETAMLVIDSITGAVLGTVQEAIKSFNDDMMRGFAGSGETLDAFGRLWEALQPIIEGVLKILGAAVLVFMSVVTGVFTGILNAADPFLGGLVMVLDSLTFAFEGVAKFFQGFSDFVVAMFQRDTEAIWESFKQMDAGIKEVVLGLVGAVVAAFGTLVASALAFVQGLYEGVTGFFQRLFDDLVGHSIIPDLVNGILEWIGKLPEQAVTLISDMVTGIKDLFTNTDWAALGRGIIDGIIEGITSLAGNLATAAQNAASNAYNAVTDFLGMESPSKLFMEVGELTMQGFALGIDAQESPTAATLESVFAGLTLDAAMPMMGGSVSPAASPVNNITNVYNDYSTNAGESYNMNVRTAETVGTVGNTIRGLQAISRVRGGG